MGSHWKYWDYRASAAYFITINSNRRIEWFGKNEGGSIRFTPVGEIAERFWREIPVHFPNVALGPFVVMPDHLHGIIILGSNDFFNGDREGVVSRRANMLPTIPEELWKIKEDHSVGRFSILDSGPIINPPGGRLIEGPLNEYSINPPSGRSIERPRGGLMECQDKTTDSQLTNMEIDRAPAEQLLPQQFDEWMAMRYKLEKGVEASFHSMVDRTYRYSPDTPVVENPFFVPYPLVQGRLNLGRFYFDQETRLNTPPFMDHFSARSEEELNIDLQTSYMSMISPLKGSLSLIIRQYKAAVSKHVRPFSPLFRWQKRFFVKIITDPVAYENIARYIRENPRVASKSR